MSDFVEQRICIKFCVRNEFSPAETLKKLQKAFGDQTMSQKYAYKWYKLFEEDRDRDEDKKPPGRPSTSTDESHVKEIDNLMRTNGRLLIKDLADVVHISNGSVNTILKNALGIRRVQYRLVPKTLDLFEKEPYKRAHAVPVVSLDRKNYVKVDKKPRTY